MENKAKPKPGSVQAWAKAYIESTDLQHKLNPPAPPDDWQEDLPSLRLQQPGRPKELPTLERTARSLGKTSLDQPKQRAKMLHTFLHHELQAAELMGWALLAFPQTPLTFRQGLLNICLDELRHMRMYQQHLQHLGYGVGDFGVRDWFWQRIPQCQTALQFVALMGIGLEGGNLDHSQRFAQSFRQAGDEAGARLQEKVGEEEVMHVAFAVHWFKQWTGGLDFARWQDEIVEPLTPSMLQGKPLNTRARNLAGLDPEFLASLQQCR